MQIVSNTRVFETSHHTTICNCQQGLCVTMRMYDLSVVLSIRWQQADRVASGVTGIRAGEAR